MSYVVPQVLVFQELQLVPVADLPPLPAHISGGHADLIRYDEEDEKADGLLGYYEPASDTAYAWPNRPTGGKADSSYTRVYIDDALLKYYEDFIGSGDTIATVASTRNQVRADATAFKTNTASYPRDSVFLDRDVRVGDVAKIRAVVGSDVYTLWTYVSGFVAEVVAAVVASAAGDSDNQATQGTPTAAATYTGSDDVRNCVDVSAINQTAYSGLASGDVNETYTITVLEGSAGGDATTARLRVLSASGRDNVAEVTPAAFGAATTIGTRGLTVTFSDTDTAGCSLSAQNNAVSDIDFLPGQRWTVTCGQAFTAPTATSGGTYSNSETVTYIVEVTTGGLYASSPKITVTTDLGVDPSGPTTVPGSATAVPIGGRGVTISFSGGTGLRKGDRYLVAVTGEGEGAVQTLVLGHNFHTDVQDNGETEVDLTLFIRKDIEVSEQRYDAPGVYNWEQSDTEITLNAGITALDSTWTDGGVVQPLPVYSELSKTYGRTYVEARYWRSTLCGSVETIFDVSEISDAISGPLHPDNPLKWGVFKAVSNSNGRPVSYTSVCDPNDVDSWLEVLELIDGRSDTYGLVPLTRNKTVLDAFEAHVNSQSSPELGRWRVLWVNLPAVTEKVVVSSENSSNGNTVLATLSDDPDTSGTQYTLLQVPAGNADFVTNDVLPGDIVRFLYTADGFGGTTYTEFEVDAILNEDSLRLATGHSAAVNSPQKIEVWRNLNASAQAAEQALTLGYSNRRVRAVWPDEVGSGGLVFPGYHLCAALAGLCSGVAPQQGLTNLSISGFDDLSRTVEVFNRTQLNTMAAGGVWIVTTDPDSGQVFTRHAVTTGDTNDINQREESITRNLDNISYFFQELLSPYIGISNVTDSLLTVLAAEIDSGLRALLGRNFVDRLGGQIRDGSLRELREHAVLRDRVVAVVDLDLPYALNNVELHLVA